MITNKHSVGKRRRKEPCTPKASRFSDLTPREMDVLVLLAAGQTSKLVAHDLGISPKTVELHRAKIMGKTRCRTLVELGVLWGEARAETAPLKGAGEPGGSIALRTAFATVSEMGGEASRHRLQINHLTVEQLRQRARGDREDAFDAAQRGSIATTAMLLTDAERCEARADELEMAWRITMSPAPQAVQPAA